MNRIYTCYECGFPWVADEDHIPAVCPTCGATPEHYLSEPGDDVTKRRIHVLPPEPDPNWPKYDTRFHPPKHFPAHTRNGRIRRFVLSYDDAKTSYDFYHDIFGWDIIPLEHTDKENPTMFCATGPSSPNWEPRVASFANGFLRAKSADPTGADPLYMIEVDSIEDTCKKVVEFGGQVIRETYEEDGQK